MSVKQLEEQLENWLNKNEIFMKSIPGVWESFVNVQLDPYVGEEFEYKHLTYWWCKEFFPKSYETIWKYKGEPRNMDELRELKIKYVRNSASD